LLCSHIDVAVEFGIEPLDAIEVRRRDFYGGHGSCFELFGKLGNRQKAEFVRRHDGFLLL